MVNLFYVMVGAALGASGRHLLTWGANRLTDSTFPWGTLVVNLLGCLAIGVAWGLAVRGGWPATARSFLFVGVLGSFTTFSSFGLETLRLVEHGAFLRAAVYVLVSNVLGLALVWAGLAGVRA